MFYSKFMFVKKGPLAKVWLAAHFHRKLNKQMVQGTDINLSAKSILEPSSPLALRLSGQLLLGLVRIYSKKVKYLQEDCSDALTKIKNVFVRQGAMNLPPESAVAPAGVITHPDNFDEIEYAIPDVPIENFDEMVHEVIAAGAAQSSLGAPHLDSLSVTRDEITLPDDVFGPDLGGDLLQDFPTADLRPFDEPDEETKVSDVERVRGSQDGEDFDIQVPARPEDLISDAGLSTTDGGRKSIIPAGDLSAFDTTEGEAAEREEKESVVSFTGPAAEAANMPTTPVPAPPPEPEVEVEEAKRPKPRRKMRRDQTTEINSKVIAAGLQDTSDIRLAEGRQVIPFTKRAKLRHACQKTNLSLLMRQPSGFVPVSLGTIPVGPEAQVGIAPELWGILERAAALVPGVELPASQEELARLAQEIAEEKAIVGEEVKEDEVPAEHAFEPAEMASMIDDTTTIGDRTSIGAPTPAKAPEEEPDEPDREPEARTYDDDLDHDRKQLEEFFGEAKKKGKKGEAEEEEEVVQLGWGGRTDKMLQVLSNEMKKGKTSIGFEALMEGRPRKVAAGVFYQLLVLKSHGIIQVSQKAPYDDIVISELKKKTRASASASD